MGTSGGCMDSRHLLCCEEIPFGSAEELWEWGLGVTNPNGPRTQIIGF